MSFKLRIIDGGRVGLVRATGAADRQDWLVLVRTPALATAAVPPGLLVDLRRRSSLPTVAVARDVGEDLADAIERFPGVALVSRPGAQYGLSRISYALAEHRGVHIRSFVDLRPAFEWVRALSGSDPRRR